jgi:flagellar hook-associated protein 3 FlgL
MRVSTSMIFDGGVSTMQKRMGEALKLQQQLATNRRMLTPSDDPVAAAQALEVTQALNINKLYMSNQDNASDTMALAESQLDSAGTLMQSLYERMVNLGNGSLTEQDRKTITNELREGFKQLVGYANQTDGLGNYLFSGYRGDTLPFTGDIDNGMTYHGDAGHRELQVSAARSLQVSESGLDIFMRVPNTSVPFRAEANAANTGTARISLPTVTDQALWSVAGNAQIYDITFTDIGGGDFTYDVTDYQGTSIGSGTYTPTLDTDGNPVPFKLALPGMGAEVTITGTPANGDVYNVRPSGTTDVFSILSEIVAAVEGPSTLDVNEARAVFDEKLGHALTNIQSAMDNMLKYRANFGARMQEAEQLQSAGSDRSLHYSTTLSRLQDIDPVKTISELSQVEMTLQAAQMSFSQVSKLSLFNYL